MEAVNPTLDKDQLLAEISAAEEELTQLDQERELVRARIRELNANLDRRATRNIPEPAPRQSVDFPATAADKVALFRQLFRGRDDVYPRLWSNPKSSKSGYSPVCGNEWVRGVCDKPKVKCGSCPNQAFLPVTDRVLQDHLQGRHVAGVYPLLSDDTCWFLAVDFDDDGWQDDVLEFRATCRAAGIVPAIERSRSGNGAHVWFFFETNISASVARAMASHLISETMARHHQLSMASYDRFFPSQDTMPRGGFGNLIALPLQHAAREKGNTVFLDSHLEPYSDQWAYLAALPRLKTVAVETIAPLCQHR